MTHYVGVKEFRQNIDKYAKEAQKGNTMLVLKHNKPLFEMNKPRDKWGDEGEWETVVSFRDMKGGGAPAEEVLKALRKIRQEDKKAKGG